MSKLAGQRFYVGTLRFNGDAQILADAKAKSRT